MVTALSTHVEGDRAVVVLDGDLIVPTARRFLRRLRTLARRRDVKRVVIDFSRAGRVDSAGVAAVSLGGRLLTRSGKKLDLTELGVHHKAAFEMLPRTIDDALAVEQPGVFERVGDGVLGAWSGARALASDDRRHGSSGLPRLDPQEATTRRLRRSAARSRWASTRCSSSACCRSCSG